MNNESIGKIIKNIRKENNLSQQQLASILGLNNSTISKWEHDLIIPDITYLRILSEKFNIPLDRLIAGETKAKKKSKSHLFLTLIILIETIIILLFSVYTIKQEDLSIYQLSSSNEQLYLKGTSISGNNKIYLSINEINYFYEKSGTKERIIPESITIKIKINNRTIVSEFIENKDNLSIEDILGNTTINLKEKYKSKDKITLELTIQESDSIYKISTNINQQYIKK